MTTACGLIAVCAVTTALSVTAAWGLTTVSDATIVVHNTKEHILEQDTRRLGTGWRNQAR